VDEGEQRLAHGGRIDRCRRSPDRAAALEPFHALMDGGRRETDTLAELDVADGRVFDQNA
jgi:hypothetical protein